MPRNLTKQAERLIAKYQSTKYFCWHNENPKGKITGDCVIRAIAAAVRPGNTNWYVNVLRGLTDMQEKTGYMLNEPKCFGKYLESVGFIKMPAPKNEDGTRMTGRQFLDNLNNRSDGKECVIVANIGIRHDVCISRREGSYKILDTWDSSRGKVGNYWVKYTE